MCYEQIDVSHIKPDKVRIELLFPFIPVKTLVELICAYGVTYILHVENYSVRLNDCQCEMVTWNFFGQIALDIYHSIELHSIEQMSLSRSGKKRFRNERTTPNRLRSCHFDLLSDNKWHVRYFFPTWENVKPNLPTNAYLRMCYLHRPCVNETCLHVYGFMHDPSTTSFVIGLDAHIF